MAAKNAASGGASGATESPSEPAVTPAPDRKADPFREAVAAVGKAIAGDGESEDRYKAAAGIVAQSLPKSAVRQNGPAVQFGAVPLKHAGGSGAMDVIHAIPLGAQNYVNVAFSSGPIVTVKVLAFRDPAPAAGDTPAVAGNDYVLIDYYVPGVDMR